MLAAMVAAQKGLSQAWTLAVELDLEEARQLLDSAATDNANAINETFPGVFSDPMSCYDEPFPTGEV